MKAIIHVHTRHSYDCLTRPSKIVDWAVKNNIDVLCITDHDKVEGSLEAAAYAREKYSTRLQVIPGAEFSSSWGDIIGLNVTENIATKDPEEIICLIRQAGGLVLLPHPFVSHKNVEWLSKEADAIEIFNARASKQQNKSAEELAKRFGKPAFVGSDAHSLAEAGLCINHFHLGHSDFIKALLTGERYFETIRTRRSLLHRSQLIKGIKKGNLRLAASSGWRWMSTAF